MSRHENPRQFGTQESDDLTLLRGTRDAIAKRGWCTGELENYEGRVCLMGGALLHLTGYAGEYDLCKLPQLGRLAGLVGYRTGDDWDSIGLAVEWNNRATRDIVMSRLDAVIKRLEALA